MNRVTFMNLFLILCLIKIVISKVNSDNILSKAKITEYNFRQSQNLPDTTKLNTQLLHRHIKRRSTFPELTAPCGPSILIATTEVQTLKSPNYPNGYPRNLRCKWTIKTKDSDHIYSFKSVDVMLTDIYIPCGGDYLEVAKGAPHRRPRYGSSRYCGNNETQLEYYRAAVSVTFNSDAINNEGHGFSLTYKIADCNKTYTEDYGVISSTTEFEDVHISSRCHMHVTAATGRTISLYFIEFSFSVSPNCTQTYMKIYDGNSNNSPLLAHYCGRIPLNPVFSTGNELTIEANKVRSGARYLISYLTTDKGKGCGGSITASEGAVSSPLYPQTYNQTGECLWYIAVPGYRTVRLDIINVALTATSGCITNYLEIYTGKVIDSANRVLRYCGQDYPSRFHELQSNEAVIKLVTDTTNDQSGFYIYFSSSS